MFFSLTVITMEELETLPNIMSKVYLSTGRTKDRSASNLFQESFRGIVASEPNKKDTHSILEAFIWAVSLSLTNCGITSECITFVNHTTLRDMPLYLNSDNLVKRSLAMWRLKIGK